MRVWLLVLVLMAWTSVARAGGLDIPTLYTARHAGMGGTAIGYVDDPSAVYNNPAGLAGVDDLSLLANLSVFFTNAQTSPDYPEQHIKTGTRVGPAPFIAGAYRAHDVLTVALAFYPLGAVGGKFEYDNQFGIPTLNEQKAIAFELSPAMSLNLPAGFSLGAGYRVTMLKFDRTLGPAADPSTVDVKTFGADFTGFRVGAQWRANEYFSAGVIYRHQVDLEATANRGRLLGQELTDIEGRLTVPAKFGVGVRLTLDPVSVAVDYELIRNSQFDELVVSGKIPNQGTSIEAPFVFNWHDSSTVKIGAEYAAGDHAKLRMGYAWDGQFVNVAFPSTFSSPPTDGHYVTLGAGWDAGSWEVNLAFSHRFEQERYIQEQEIASQMDCAFCGSSGNYASRLSAAFIDFSVDLDTRSDGGDG